MFARRLAPQPPHTLTFREEIPEQVVGDVQRRAGRELGQVFSLHGKESSKDDDLAPLSVEFLLTAMINTKGCVIPRGSLLAISGSLKLALAVA